jgi:cytochrome c-type biogenesis protein CcmH
MDRRNRTDGTATLVTILLLFWGLLLLWSPDALSATVDEITQELTCTCGCNMVVGACEGAMECSAADQIKAQVMEMLNQGKSKEEVLRFFVSRHGEKILSAPTKKGFNITAWVLPFFALFLGGIVLFHTLKKWLSKEGEPEKKGMTEPHPEERYLERVKEELRKFDY